MVGGGGWGRLGECKQTQNAASVCYFISLLNSSYFFGAIINRLTQILV